MHYCHANIGKAVFYTASTIIIGFSILVLSNFIPTIYFDLGAFSLGLSYDYEFGQLASMYKQSVEVSLKFNSGKKSTTL
mgnify:CR=1 FL=1